MYVCMYVCVVLVQVGGGCFGLFVVLVLGLAVSGYGWGWLFWAVCGFGVGGGCFWFWLKGGGLFHASIFIFRVQSLERQFLDIILYFNFSAPGTIGGWSLASLAPFFGVNIAEIRQKSDRNQENK